MNAIEIKDLKKIYATGVEALKGIDLTIEQGDFFALLGANGAGKTTIISILTSITNKTSGSVKVLGTDIDVDFDTVKSHFGVVPQEFNFSIFEKVLDIVVNQAGFYGIPRQEATDRARKILTDLGLGDKLNQVSRTLSGGMKRRLMIARALVHNPKILILDEPTAGVDVELRHGMWDYLLKLNRDHGVTILLTTHYLEEVEAMCRNCAIIKKGEIVKTGTVRKLLGSLEKETYVAEVSDMGNYEKITGYIVTKIDDQTLEVVLEKDQTLNDLVAAFSKNGVVLQGIRPKGNRLEELFLNIIGK